MRIKKSKSVTVAILLFLAASFIIPSNSFAKGLMKIKANPAETADRMINNPILKKLDGENFCWNAANGIQVFVNNYELTKNTEWLDAG